VTNVEEALAQAGFESSVTPRDFDYLFTLQLGADNEFMLNRLIKSDSYQWEPSSECDIHPLESAALVRELVEQGGWLMLGDSITGNHFFSVSCILGPHIRLGPPTEWPNHIYLSRNSPLISELNYPEGFDIDKTPLVSFQRLDVLYAHPELVAFHKTLYGPPSNFSLFDESIPSYTLSPSEFMPMFTAPLPQANYGTLLVSTAGHWTTSLFHGFHDESKAETGYGIDGILDFYRHVVRRWALEIQEALSEDQRRGTRGTLRPRQVVLRSYNPGHEDCHDYTDPWAVYQPYKEKLFNWPWIKDFNKITEEVISSHTPRYPNIHYVEIDRPGLLRPDAHLSTDCLHLFAGSGVMEGWTQYVLHFLTRELGRRV